MLIILANQLQLNDELGPTRELMKLESEKRHAATQRRRVAGATLQLKLAKPEATGVGQHRTARARPGSLVASKIVYTCAIMSEFVVKGFQLQPRLLSFTK